jgi:hypothetical protein
MAWCDQDPPATDVLLDVTVPFSGGGTPAYLEIDKLPDGRYRATVGTLLDYQELCRTAHLPRHEERCGSDAADDDGRGAPWIAPNSS